MRFAHFVELFAGWRRVVAREAISIIRPMEASRRRAIQQLSPSLVNRIAYEIRNRGGAISDVQAAAANPGTVVEVRNLFYNTPARRKFMKGSTTEFGYIAETMLRTALPHPLVAFTLAHNGRVTLDLP